MSNLKIQFFQSKSEEGLTKKINLWLYTQKGRATSFKVEKIDFKVTENDNLYAMITY